MRPTLARAIYGARLGWAGRAHTAIDFTTDELIAERGYRGRTDGSPHFSFSRALSGYALNKAGALESFASGSLRRTDRGLLIEGARTNMCLQSQTFNNSFWGKSNSSVTADQTAAPDGTTTADQFTENTANTSHLLTVNTLSVTSGTNYCFSLYAKAGTSTRIQLTFLATGFAGGAYANVDLNTGTILASGGTIVNSGAYPIGNGWVRAWVTAAASATSAVSGPVIAHINADAATRGPVYVGASNTAFIWGAQMEEGVTFPSSYIPTTTASVARPADVLTLATSSLVYPIGMFCEFERVVDTGGVEHLLSVDSGAVSDRARLAVDASDRGEALLTTSSSDVAQIAITGALSLFTTYRLAARFATNDTNAARSGTLGTTDTVCAVPATPTTIRIGADVAGANPCFGYIRRVAIYDRIVPDFELTARTT